jgi:hypothetical protein
LAIEAFRLQYFQIKASTGAAAGRGHFAALGLMARGRTAFGSGGDKISGELSACGLRPQIHRNDEDH